MCEKKCTQNLRWEMHDEECGGNKNQHLGKVCVGTVTVFKAILYTTSSPKVSLDMSLFEISLEVLDVSLILPAIQSWNAFTYQVGNTGFMMSVSLAVILV